MNLIAESLNYTVWHEDQVCVEHSETYWEEISESDQSWLADSTELLILAADQWKKMIGPWVVAIPWARSSLPKISRGIWLPVAKAISADPHDALVKLGNYFRSYSMAMSVFEEGLQNFLTLNSDSDFHDESDWDETLQLVDAFLKGHKNAGHAWGYESNRIPLMDFCIHNQLSPASFAVAADSFLDSSDGVSWYEVVQADGPLNCVVNACHAIDC